MAELGRCFETESLGRNLYQTTIGIKPLNYQDKGIWKHISNDWINSGIGLRPHIVTSAPFIVSVSSDGDRRIHPTREDDVWFEISGAKINQSGTWKTVKLGTPTSRKNNRITWVKNNFNTYMDMAGHYVKLGYLLKNGFMPPNNQFAYEVATNGLTRQGGMLLKDGVLVMHLRKPVVYDWDNPDDVRQIAHEITRIDSKWHVVFTLPSLAGMSKPLIDPTLELQPDAAAGKDTRLESATPDNNYGIHGLGYVTNARYTLIQFDLSSIPNKSTIKSATLSVKVSNATINTVGIHRGLVEWFEGVEYGADPGAADASTWNHKNANSGGEVAWGAAGGLAGTDYVTAATSGVAAPGVGWMDHDVASDIQLFVNDIANYGHWYISNGADTMIASSSDNATAADRPKLVVVYTLPVSSGVKALQNQGLLEHLLF